MTSTPRSCFVSATASAASNVQPPTKTDSRRNSRCSASPSRSWLQAIAARSVCWRAGRSRAPPVRICSRLSSRPSIAAGGSVLTRAAASSMASGRPSRRLQISAIARAFSLVSAKSGLDAVARSTNSITAGLRASVSSDVVARGVGPRQRQHRHLVLAVQVQRLPARDQDLERRVDREQIRRRTGTAPRRCSKLSSSSSIGAACTSRGRCA